MLDPDDPKNQYMARPPATSTKRYHYGQRRTVRLRRSRGSKACW